jgi:hypothetical protein
MKDEGGRMNPDSAVAIAAKSEEQTFHSETRFFPDSAGKKRFACRRTADTFN